MISDHCPLCESNDIRRYSEFAEADQVLYRCDGCGLYFINPHKPWIPSVTDGADAETFSFWGSEEAHRAYAKWRTEENDRVADMILADGRQGRLLEIGFGEGPLTERLLPHTGEYWGIEPVPSHYRDTVERLRLDQSRCLCIAAEDMPDHPALSAARGSFDTIVMVSVFEHLSGTRDILKSCAALLKPGGRLIISVPDSTFFPYLLFIRRMAGMEPWSRFHTSFFSDDSLRRAFTECGFSVDEASRHSLLTSASIDYYGKLKNSKLLRSAMTVFRAAGLDRALRVSTTFYKVVRN
jgi:SAM-dependent methyltransferase